MTDLTPDRDALESAAESGSPAIAIDSAGPAFLPSVPVADAPRGLIAIKSADIDGDGDMDIVGRTSLGDAGINWFANDGAGSLSLAGTVTASVPWRFAAGDIDGDGLADVVGGDYASGSTLWYRNNGDGTFAVGESVGAGTPNTVVVTDIDGDGDSDVLGALTADGKVLLHSQNGDGTFTTTEIDPGFAYAIGAAAGDLDGDGRADIVASGTSAAEVRIYLAGEDGSFSHTGTVDVTAALGVDFALETLKLADIDGDGDLDAVAISANDQGIYLLAGNGDGTFASPTVIAAGERGAGSSMTDFEILDVDGDGRLDIVAPATAPTDTGEGTLALYRQTAEGTFVEQRIAEASASLSSDFNEIEVVDLDGDGIADIVTAGAIPAGDGTSTYLRVARGLPSLQVDENTASAVTGLTFGGEGDGAVVVTLAVDRGSLDAVSGAGVTVAGGGDALTLTGTVADINGFVAAGNVTFLTDLYDETGALLTATLDDPAAEGPQTAELILAVVPQEDAAPTDVAIDGDSVAEDATAGAVIGTLSATDPEGQSVTFSLVNDASGLFALDGDTLVLKGALDHEAAQSYALVVRATDIGGEFTDAEIVVNVGDVNEAPTGIALSGEKVVEGAAAGTVVGALSGTDPDAGETLTYTIADDSGAFEIVGGELRVKHLGDALKHTVTVVATDAGGLTFERTFTVRVTDAAGNPLGSEGTITFDLSTATAGIDVEAFIRGGFTAEAAGGGFPVFDNGTAFAGTEMVIGYGAESVSKYVLARGDLEYYFGTHTVAGSIETIEFGTRGQGTYDEAGAFVGGDAALRITGLTLANPIPTDATDEAEIEANGPVHNFALAYMYGTSSSQERLDTFADALDEYSQHFVGSAYGDTLTGGVFADTIEGGGGDDLLVGGGGSDVLEGGEGSDRAEGGDGEDTYLIAGNRADYDIYFYSSVYVVSRIDGSTDTLVSVETIRFADVEIDVATEVETPIGGENTAPTITVSGEAAGWFTAATLAGIDGPRGFDVADLDGDGDLDIVAAIYSGDSVVWFEYADGAFGPAEVLVPVIDAANDIVVADVDGDGDMDFVAAAYVEDVVRLYTNDGSGNFTATDLGSLDGARHLELADVDGDGDLDAIVAGYNADEIVLYENLGGGAFGEASVLGTGNGPTQIVTADLNGDGLVDILAPIYSDGEIRYFENTGEGFAEGVSLVTLANARNVAVGDVDGDGDLDMVGANYTGDEIVLFKNAGDGTFDAGTLIATPDGPESITLADVDGDGDLDILTAAYNADAVLAYDNLGDGTFGAAEVIAEGAAANSPWSVVPAEVGGAASLVVSNYSSDTLSVLRYAAGTLAVDGDAPSPVTGLSFADEGTGAVTVTLGVTVGTLDATSGDGVAVAGEGSGTLTLTGTVADINAFVAAGALTVTVPNGAKTDLTVAIDDGSGAENAHAAVSLKVVVGAPPADLALSGDLNVLENDPAGTLVGTLSASDPDGDPITYTLVEGGSWFEIVGDEVRLLSEPDLGDKTLTVRATDINGNSVEETFTVAVTDVNEAPEVTLSLSSVAENAAPGTVFARAIATDDENEAITYELTDDAGGRFALGAGDGAGYELLVAGPLDYESATSHDIVITVTDASGNAHAQTFTITVEDVDESIDMPPTDLSLSRATVFEDAAVGTVVGALSAVDPEGGDLTYRLTDDAGGLFALVTDAEGTRIVVAGGLDHETAALHQVTVEVEDEGGNVVARDFAIGVADQPETETTMITIDASGAAAMDFDTFLKGGFLAGVEGGGFPVFDNSTAFSGTEMVMSFGEDATSPYVLAHGSLEYYFGTHTVWGEIETIEFGTKGAGTYDENGYFVDGDTQLLITGLEFANAREPEAEVEATGPVHNFAVGYMYGSDADPNRLQLFLDQLDSYAQTYIGSAGADVFAASAHDDIVGGGAGNDSLTGLGGDDAIDGGEGEDTAGYRGVAADYAVTLNDDGTVTVADTVADRDGTDTLSGIEFLAFTDGSVEVPTEAEDLAPTDVVLSNTVISESARTGMVVGTLSAADPEGEAVTFTLVDGAGDNNSFALREGEDGTIRVALTGTLDHEQSDGVYDLVVSATDPAGNETIETISITVEDDPFKLSSVPTGKDYTAVMENAPVGTQIGFVYQFDTSFVPETVELTDDAGGLFSVTLGEAGGTPYSFLTVNGPLDHETDDLHEVTIKATDAGGVSFEKTFNVHVLDAPEATDEGIAARGTITIDAATMLAAENGGVDWNTYLDKAFANIVPGLPGFLPEGTGWSPDTPSSEFVYANTADGTLISLKGSDLVYNWTDPVSGEDAHVVSGNVAELAFGNGVLSPVPELDDPEVTITGLDLFNDSSLLNRIEGETQLFAQAWMYGLHGSNPADIEFVKATLASYAQNFLGSSGDDSFTGTLFGDVIHGGGGDDDLAGGDGDDLIHGGGGADRLFGDAGEDVLNGRAGDDLIRGGDDKDVVRGGAGDDIINGDAGNDLILGGDGDDLLYGGSGNDRIRAGAGDDIVRTGRGKDIVVLDDGFGTDRVINFTDGRDRIDLRNLTGVDSLDDLAMSETPSGSAVIGVGDDMLILTGISQSLLDSADFII